MFSLVWFYAFDLCSVVSDVFIACIALLMCLLELYSVFYYVYPLVGVSCVCNLFKFQRIYLSV